jgi:hypothetical protein
MKFVALPKITTQSQEAYEKMKKADGKKIFYFTAVW